MKLTGLHVLLTYNCVYECDHCFVWGSPQQSGVFSLARLDIVLEQALQLGSIRDLYFEGGETLVYYPVLISAVRRAARHFKTAIVTNGYWATSVGEAGNWLGRLANAGLRRIEFSLDELHGADPATELHPGVIAARELGLEVRVRRVTMARPGREACNGYHRSERENSRGQTVSSPVENLPRHAWTSFTTCPYEDLVDPRRVRVDPYGDVHLCQGLVISNLFDCPLPAMVASYRPREHPIIGPLIAGGPAEVARRYNLEPEATYVDACHLCSNSLQALHARFPSLFDLDKTYGARRAISGGEPEVVPD